MNIHFASSELPPSKDEAAAALAVLRAWAARANEAEISALDKGALALLGGGYPVLSRDYPHDFDVTTAYKDSLPDLQNGPSSLIRGAKQLIQHVGISNFRLPLRYKTKAGAPVVLETSVTEGHQHVPHHAVLLCP
jgi:GTP cyclohydrolase IB